MSPPRIILPRNLPRTEKFPWCGLWVEVYSVLLIKAYDDQPPYPAEQYNQALQQNTHVLNIDSAIKDRTYNRFFQLARQLAECVEEYHE